ncbi:hypothetical protein EVAR_65890_1 [Eumeta japonica]|uniref:Uncharacterized protein n=1 Tax=Eumeta variegata TaxID=151549 RepID=A0A4C1SXD1_EUMVA|nr:hypothetical protein EVAR_65890_1 [Eumeta japonica]
MELNISTSAVGAPCKEYEDLSQRSKKKDCQILFYLCPLKSIPTPTSESVLTEEEAIALMLQLGLTRDKYITLRKALQEKGVKVLPSYDALQEKKKSIIPSPIEVDEHKENLQKNLKSPEIGTLSMFNSLGPESVL